MSCSDVANDTPVNMWRTAISWACSANAQCRFSQWQDWGCAEPPSRRQPATRPSRDGRPGGPGRRGRSMRQATATAGPRPPGRTARCGPQRQPIGSDAAATATPEMSPRCPSIAVRPVAARAGALRRDRPPDWHAEHVDVDHHDDEPGPRQPRRPPRTSSTRCATRPTARRSWRPSCPDTGPACSARSPRHVLRPTPVALAHDRRPEPTDPPRVRRTPMPRRCSTRWPPSTRRSTATASCRRTRHPTPTTWCRRRWRSIANGERPRSRCSPTARWTAPLPAAGYQLPTQVNNPTDAANLAVRMEEDTAVAWRAVLEQATTGEDRTFAVTALTESAVTAGALEAECSASGRSRSPSPAAANS